MTTDAQKRAAEAHRAKLKAQGFVQTAVWLSGPAAAELKRLAAAYGSTSEAMERLLLAPKTAQEARPAARPPRVAAEPTKPAPARSAAAGDRKPKGYTTDGEPIYDEPLVSRPKKAPKP